MWCDNVFLIGDFNPDPFSGRTWRKIEACKKRTKIYCFDTDLLSDDSYTFVSYGSSVTMWLKLLVGKKHNFIKVHHLIGLVDIAGCIGMWSAEGSGPGCM